MSHAFNFVPDFDSCKKSDFLTGDFRVPRACEHIMEPEQNPHKWDCSDCIFYDDDPESCCIYPDNPPCNSTNCKIKPFIQD